MSLHPVYRWTSYGRDMEIDFRPYIKSNWDTSTTIVTSEGPGPPLFPVYWRNPTGPPTAVNVPTTLLSTPVATLTEVSITDQ